MYSPYDWEIREEGQNAQRIESQFLARFTPKLVDGGVLIYIIPFHVLMHEDRYLARHYEKINVYRFPREEYKLFHQIVLFGTRKTKPFLDEELSLTLEETSEESLEELCFQEMPLYHVPQSSSPQFFFSMDISPEECMEYVKDSPLWESFRRVFPYLDFRFVDRGFPLGLSVGQSTAVGLDSRPYKKLKRKPRYRSSQVYYGYLPLGNGEDNITKVHWKMI